MARRKKLKLIVEWEDDEEKRYFLDTTVAYDSSYHPTLVGALNTFGPDMLCSLTNHAKEYDARQNNSDDGEGDRSSG
jgi:hypothetical protein